MPISRRSAAVGLGVTAALAGALTVAAVTHDDDYDYRGVCVDEASGQRVSDDECDDHDGGGVFLHGGHRTRWYYMRSDQRYPAVGQKAYGGSYDVPRSGSWHAGGVKAKGGTVSRGGFGGLHGHGGS
jgi:hypothetical protein